MLYQHEPKYQPLRCYNSWKREETQTRKSNKIILIEEMHELQKSGILLTFNINCDTTKTLKRLFRNDLLHWLSKYKLVRFKITRVAFHMVSWLFRMTVAPSMMRRKSSFRVCSFPWYTKSFIKMAVLWIVAPWASNPTKSFMFFPKV
jgi:hypothetical protein